MTKATAKLLQRIARGTFVGLCTAMALGVVGAVSVRGENVAAPTMASAVTVEATALPISLAYETVPAVAPVESQAVEMSTAKVGRASRVVRMEVTGYCPCTKCCGPNAQGITASGKQVSYNRGRFVAADTKVLPFGTKLSIPGYHGAEAVEVIDRGGAIKGKKLDLYFPTHQAALNWGRQMVDVTVME
jgi:3D (Asp-Asp-Asp) domain-containing protein